MKIEGTVKKEIFYSHDSSFGIYLVLVDKKAYNLDEETLTVKGYFSEPLILKKDYILYGEFVHNPKYGKQYSVEKYDIKNIYSNDEEFLRSILTESEMGLYYCDNNIIKYINDKDIECRKPAILKKLKDTKAGIGDKKFDLIISKIKSELSNINYLPDFRKCFGINIVRLISRIYGDDANIRKKFYNNPYDFLMSLPDIGFVRADSILINASTTDDGNKIGVKPDILHSKQRCEAYIKYKIKKYQDSGSTVFNFQKLLKDINAEVPECSKWLKNILDDNKIVCYRPYYNSISLRSTMYMEKYIGNSIISALSSNNFSIPCVNFENYREFISDNGTRITLNDKQMNILEQISNNSIVILNGPAGTGKSSVVATLLNLLNDYNITYCLAAPTGRAAKVLSEYTRAEVKTIHRLLQCDTSGKFRCDNNFKLDYSVIIVDEASMIDLYVFYYLIRSIDFIRTKLLIIGDTCQIPSIGCGNILHDLINSETIPTTNLTEVFRYEYDGLIQVVTNIRNKDFIIPAKFGFVGTELSDLRQFSTKEKSYTYIDCPDELIPEAVEKLYIKLLSEGNKREDIQIITTKNVGRTGTLFLNSKLQKNFNANYFSNNFVKGKGEIAFYVDDPIIQCVNYYNAKPAIYDSESDMYIAGDSELFIANGETGYIYAVQTDKDEVVVNYGTENDSCLVIYNKKEINNLNLAYAVTVFKAQGSQYPITIVITASADYNMLNNNLIYVSLTRSQKKCYHIGDRDTINFKIGVSAENNRNTALSDILKGIKNNEKLCYSK